MISEIYEQDDINFSGKTVNGYKVLTNFVKKLHHIDLKSLKSFLYDKAAYKEV